MAEIVFNNPITSQTEPKDSGDLQSQVQNLQTTLASLNQQVIVLQETLQERDQKIKELEEALTECRKEDNTSKRVKIDGTLTIVGAFIKLYKLFLPGKAV